MPGIDLVTSERVSPFPLPFDFPRFTVDINDGPAPGFVFTTNASLRTANVERAPHLIVLDNDGSPVFFRETESRVHDFKLHEATGLLSYAELASPARIVTLDATYTPVDTFLAGNGYEELDFHDFEMLPNGHVLIIIYDWQTVDMSRIVEGGQKDARVAGLVIQELDDDKNVVFQWRSWDHFEITDAQDFDFTSQRIDYVHCNAIETDFDGSILFSGRSTNEITKIDRETGEVLWRMGGLRNQFTLIDDDRWFSRQHAIRRLENGNVLLFDNGTAHRPQVSRAVEYCLDEVKRTATLVWEYEHREDLYGPIVGYAQRLPNGNTFVSFGNSGVQTEVRPDGSVAWEMRYEPEVFNYRAFRFPWSAEAQAPDLWIAEVDTLGRSVTLGFETFGRSDATEYAVIHSGTSGQPSAAIPLGGRSHRVLDLPDGIPVEFEVEARDSAGRILGRSMPLGVHLKPGLVNPIRVVEVSWGASGAQIRWDVLAGSNVVGFRVYRRESGVDHVAKVSELLPPKSRSYVDPSATADASYVYVLEATLADDAAVRAAGVPIGPSFDDLQLFPNQPNPVTNSTQISFGLPAAGDVTLEIFDVAGRRVRVVVDDAFEAGRHRTTWDGTDRQGNRVPAGTYLYRLSALGRTVSKKLIFLGRDSR